MRLLARLLTTAAAVAVAAVSAASAQTLVIENDGLIKTVGPNGYHEFHLTLKNTGLGGYTVRVKRTLNELPGQGWQSAICSGELCYAPDVDLTDPITIGPYGEYSVKLNVFAGSEPGVTGNFRLAVIRDDEVGEEITAVEIQTTVGTSSVAVDPSMSVAGYPNPAVDHVVLPLGEVGTATSVQVFAADGSLVRAIDGESLSGDRVRVDVSDLGSGAYFYRVLGSERTNGGSFVVAR